MKGKRIELKKIKELIENKNGTFLEEFIIKYKRFIKIKCNKDGNTWIVALNNLMNKGQWCRKCYKTSKVRKIEFEKVISLTKEKGFELLTTGNIDYWSEILIRCSKHNFEWKTNYGHLLNGHSNCKLCGSGTIDFETLNNIIVSNNATLIRRMKTIDTVRNIELECNIHKHRWFTNATDILKLDRWCYYCSWKQRKTSYKTIKNKVNKNGGTLLTKDCIGSTTRIWIRCSNGHKWETCYDFINSGRWCPECPNKTQTVLHSIIKDLFPDYETKYNYRGFKWLKDKKTMELDIWIPDLKLAIEYDGEQHFKPIKFATNISDNEAQKNLINIKRRDRKKDKLIAEHPNDIKYFIRFNYKDKINQNSVIERLKKYNISIMNK